VWAGNFDLLHRVQTGSSAHPASHPTGIEGSFPEGKMRGMKLTTHLLVPRSRMRGTIPNMSSWRGA